MLLQLFQMPVGVLKLRTRAAMEKLRLQAEEVLLTTAHVPTEQLTCSGVSVPVLSHAVGAEPDLL